MKYKQSSFVNNPSFLTWVSEDAAKSQKWYIMINVKAETAGRFWIGAYEDAAKSQKWYIMINVKAETAGRFWIGVKILNTAQVGHALIS